jgi:DNA topoisomerase-1
MVPAQMEQVKVTVSAASHTLRANGQRMLFAGYRAAFTEDDADRLLHRVDVGQKLPFISLNQEDHATEPPPRYSEATLVKALEEHGIGRPSTYASTISTLVERNYVQVDQRRLVPETVGKQVTDLLIEHFPQVVDTGFTASMEEKLDAVADGEVSYAGLLGDFWQPFITHLKEEEPKIVKISTEEASDEICPICESPMVIKQSRFGRFYACTKFPDCKGTKPLVAPVAETGLICPKCGKDLQIKRSRSGPFYGCTGYPDCRFALSRPQLLSKKLEKMAKDGEETPFKEQALEKVAEFLKKQEESGDAV